MMKLHVEIYHWDDRGDPVVDEAYTWNIHYQQTLQGIPRLSPKSQEFFNKIIEALTDGFVVELRKE